MMKAKKNTYRFDFDDLHDALTHCEDPNEVTRTLLRFSADAFAVAECNFFLFNDDRKLESRSINISISLDRIVNHLEEEGITDWAIDNNTPTVISDFLADNSANSSVILIPIAAGRSAYGLFVARANCNKADLADNMLAELDRTVKLAAIVYDKLIKYNDNRLLDKRLKAAETHILDFSKFISAGELAASIANEIQTSLLILDGHIRFLETGVGNTKRRLNIINKELSTIKSINRRLAGLLDVAEADEEPSELNICEIIDDIILLTSHRLDKDNIIIDKSFDVVNDCVMGSRQMLEQAFLNIILSAGNHMIDGGTLQISISSQDNDYIIINFSDINPNPYSLNVDDIFEPFYCSVNKQSNFGMGLYLSYMIIRSHGGKAIAISEEGRGRTIKVFLPAHNQ